MLRPFRLLAALIVLASIPRMALAVAPPSPEDAARLEREGVNVAEFIADLQARMLPPEDLKPFEPQNVIPGLREISTWFGADVTITPRARLIDYNADGTVDERDVLQLGFRSRTLKKASNFFEWDYIAPSIGPQRTLVVLCQFSDVAADAQHDWDYWERLFNSSGEMPGGSFVEYWEYSSFELLEPTVDIFDSGVDGGWITLPGERDSYKNNEFDLLFDAMDIIDDSVDFSLYDNDGDGCSDSLIFILQGEKGGSRTYWPHKSWMTQHYRDGVIISPYVIDCEEDGVGTIIHEHAHAMGVPDLYGGYLMAAGIGNWGLQGMGNYVNDEQTPPYSCPLFKSVWGWIDPVVLTENSAGLTLGPYETTGDCYKLWTNGAPETEYFLVTNYTPRANHSYLPGWGMIVWHVDETRLNNSDTRHKLCDIEEADGRDDMDTWVNLGDATDPYPSDPYNEFSGGTYPDSFSYASEMTGVEITNISAAGDVMTFDAKVEVEPQVYPFYDGFEEDLDKWTVTRESGSGDWYPVTGEAYEGDYSLWFGDPLLEGPSDEDVSRIETQRIDGRYSLKPELRFYLKTDLASCEAVVEYSPDEDEAWVECYELPAQLTEWTLVRIELHELAGESPAFRFRYTADGGPPGGGLWIDNLVYGEAPPIGPLFDGAESDGYPWWIIDEAGEEGSIWRRSLADAYSGEYCWRVCAENGDGPGASEDDWLLSPPLLSNGDDSVGWVSFREKHSATAGHAFAVLERSDYYGNRWDPLVVMDGERMDNWSDHVVRLIGSPGGQTQLRFRFYSDGSADPGEFLLDEIRLLHKPPTYLYPQTLSPENPGPVVLEDLAGAGYWRVEDLDPVQGVAWVMRDPATHKPAADDLDVLSLGRVMIQPYTVNAIALTHKRNVVQGDRLALEISVDGEYSWTEIESFEPGAYGWSTDFFDLTPFEGDYRWMRLVYEAGGTAEGKGWFVSGIELIKLD